MSDDLNAPPHAYRSAGPTDDTYRGLIESVVDYAIYRLDPLGVVVSWNPGAEHIKGYTAEEIIGSHFSRFFSEEDRAAGVPDAIIEAARSKGRHEVEGWRLRKDGGRFWALAVVDAIYGEGGSIVGFAKITRDMTERRAAIQALEDSERQFRLLVAGVTDYALYMLDPAGVVSSWNVGAERIKGYRAGEVVGSHFSRFYTPEDLATGLPGRALEIARSTGRYEAEGWRLRKDGTRFWANVIIDAIREDNGELVGFAKITRDITERRDNQIRLEEARMQLFQSQKMESIGQLTGGVAHDFNNLLTVILGGVGLARRRIEEPERLTPLLDNIAEAAERGASLTRQLLAFSRRQSLNPEAISLREMLPAFVGLLDRSLGGDIKVVTRIEDDVHVQADLRQLELALLNVGLNARDAMPGGGDLVITVRAAKLDEPNGLKGNFVAIAVTDTGEGMAPEISERVFEPFFTTKEVGRGTGLGLSQAYGFAQQSGGDVRIESEPGLGTTITFLLPEATDPVQTARPDVRAAAPDLSGRRILVVEDDSAVAAVTCALLGEAGAEIVLVDSVGAALAALGGETPFDLVFSDVVMPGGRNGFDLANRLQRDHPAMPVLLTTGYGGAAATKTSGFRLLAKPYETAELLRAVAEMLHPA